MKLCGKGHDLTNNQFEVKGKVKWGCRQCRQIAAYARWGGQPASLEGSGSNLEYRFWPKVDIRSEKECWPWIGAHLSNGYGSLGAVLVNGRIVSQIGAHRVSFFIANGHWPNITRHTCDNKNCVNPFHLIDGTTKQNAADMIERGRCPASQRTHCPQGHEYSEKNTRINKYGHRACRRCSSLNQTRYAAQRMVANPEKERAKNAARQRAYKAGKRAGEISAD